MHRLADSPYVIDVRNLGLLGAVEIASAEGEPGGRAAAVFRHCYEACVLVRASGESIVLSPPLVILQDEIAEICAALRTAIAALP